MSRLVFRNRTGHDDREVAALVRFALAELELPSRYAILVRVAHTRISERRRAAGGKYVYPASGHASSGVLVRDDVPESAAYEIKLRIGRRADFPSPWYDRRGHTPLGEIMDWREALVAIAAHEGKHVEDFQTKTRAARGTDYEQEVRCDAYAAARLRAYRLTNPTVSGMVASASNYEPQEVPMSSTSKGLETPVSYTHAVTKARKIVGPKSGKDLVAAGIVVQDVEHGGGNGKWYVNLAGTWAAKTAADAAEEVSSMSSTATETAKPQATPDPKADKAKPQDAKPEIEEGLDAMLTKVVKTAVAKAELKASPSGSYTTIRLDGKPLGYLHPQTRKGALVHLTIPPAEAKQLGVKGVEAHAKGAVKSKVYVTKAEQVQAVVAAIAAAAGAK